MSASVSFHVITSIKPYLGAMSPDGQITPTSAVTIHAERNDQYHKIRDVLDDVQFGDYSDRTAKQIDQFAAIAYTILTRPQIEDQALQGLRSLLDEQLVQCETSLDTGISRSALVQKIAKSLTRLNLADAIYYYRYGAESEEPSTTIESEVGRSSGKGAKKWTTKSRSIRLPREHEDTLRNAFTTWTSLTPSLIPTVGRVGCLGLVGRLHNEVSNSLRELDCRFGSYPDDREASLSNAPKSKILQLIELGNSDAIKKLISAVEQTAPNLCATQLPSTSGLENGSQLSFDLMRLFEARSKRERK